MIVKGQDALPDGAAITVEPVMLNRLVATQARAIVVFTVLVAALGLVAGAIAAERHLPSAAVPALRDHRACRHDARADDDADRHAPARAGDDGGARHPPRAIHARSVAPAEISAQFDPATDMTVAVQQAQSRIAETRGATAGGHRSRPPSG